MLAGAARVVYEQVDWPLVGLEARLHFGERRGMGQVGGEHFDLDPVPGSELGRELLEPILAPGDDDEVATQNREFPSECLADPFGRARDQRPWPSLTFCHVHLHLVVPWGPYS